MLRYLTKYHEVAIKRQDGEFVYQLSLRVRNDDNTNQEVALELSYQEMLALLSAFKSYVESNS
jgi:hypothetical protein